MLYMRLWFVARTFPCGSFHILMMCACKCTLSCAVVDKTCMLSCSGCVMRACGYPSCSVVDKTCMLSCSGCVMRACGCLLVFSRRQKMHALVFRLRDALLVFSRRQNMHALVFRLRGACVWVPPRVRPSTKHACSGVQAA